MSDHAGLQNVRYKHQPDLAAMDQVARAWLVAMKEFYKGMIKRGDIDTYLSIRNATAAKNQVSKPPDQDDGRVV